MSDDAFKIYVEQLRKGQVEKLEESFSPDFLDVTDKEVTFQGRVALQGEAYLADDNLVLRFDASCAATLPCVICNQPVLQNVTLKGQYAYVPLDEVKGGVFNFRETLREMILLEVPHFAECEGGNCPEREKIAKYLKKTSSLNEDEEGYQPFADLKKE